ncbi:hypothetical protein B0T25DRAFT_635637 [Lasiosphaeria hispida]|uniref:Uncharacterized protein n=1 Tax=Lasiosphaeria hispida TaxID=260671 RepID=A0AAJ0H6E3_9PEZI|nr:hypothetical protein B0T25DRAFT_635637 [Lasiosphaeria hispida]
MKTQAFSLLFLLGSALAAPAQQMQNAEQAAAAAPESTNENMMAYERRDNTPTMQNSEALAEFGTMVTDVQEQVQQIHELIQSNKGDQQAIVDALVAPLTRLNQTMAAGVSRINLPGLGNLGGLGGLGNLGGGLGLLSGLLSAVTGLIDSLLGGTPVGGGLGGGVLGQVIGGTGLSGTIGGLLNGSGGASVGGLPSNIPNLVGGILGSVGSLVPIGSIGGLLG